MNNVGTIINPHGFTLKSTDNFVGPWWDRRDTWEYTLDPENPLTYLHPDGYYIQSDRHGFTDFGTVPFPFNIVVPRTRFKPGYMVHDTACTEPHVIFLSDSINGVFVPSFIADNQASKLLYLMVLADKGYKWQANLIYTGVHKFGPQW